MNPVEQIEKDIISWVTYNQGCTLNSITSHIVVINNYYNKYSFIKNKKDVEPYVEVLARNGKITQFTLRVANEKPIVIYYPEGTTIIAEPTNFVA